MGAISRYKIHYKHFTQIPLFHKSLHINVNDFSALAINVFNIFKNQEIFKRLVDTSSAVRDARMRFAIYDTNRLASLTL